MTLLDQATKKVGMNVANLPPLTPEAFLLSNLLVVLDRRERAKGKRNLTVDLLAAELRAGMNRKLTSDTAATARAAAGALALTQVVQMLRALEAGR